MYPVSTKGAISKPLKTLTSKGIRKLIKLGQAPLVLLMDSGFGFLEAAARLAGQQPLYVPNSIVRKPEMGPSPQPTYDNLENPVLAPPDAGISLL